MILANSFRRQWEDTRSGVLDAVACVGESAWYIMGGELKQFENSLASLWTLPYCAGVASGMDALELSLKALGCGPGDPVLTTPLSAFATALAILKLGAIPVFVDTDPFGLIDLDLCEALLAKRPDIRFFVPVHLYGNAVNLVRLRALRERFGLAIVEDCAQSILGSSDGAFTGTAGQMAATSFYPTKNLGAMGDAGAILTSDESLFQHVLALRDYGQTAKYRHDYIGYNSRLDELHAAILRRVYLPRLAPWTARRRAIANRYLASISHPLVRIIASAPRSDSGYHLFPVLIADGRKPQFIEYLHHADIGSGEHYPFLIPDQKAMSGVPFEVWGEFSQARRIAESEVSLPIHPYMTDGEVECVIETCNRWPG